jgi:hypothetical protein
MNATEWLAAYADRLGAEPPTPEELDAVLALAGVAAHASERVAARAGVGLEQAMRLAQEIGSDG